MAKEALTAAQSALKGTGGVTQSGDIAGMGQLRGANELLGASPRSREVSAKLFLCPFALFPIFFLTSLLPRTVTLPKASRK